MDEKIIEEHDVVQAKKVPGVEGFYNDLYSSTKIKPDLESNLIFISIKIIFRENRFCEKKK